MKRAIFFNIPYLLDHADEIINNTDVLLPEWILHATETPDDGDVLKDIWNRMRQKHLHESGNWYIFGRGNRWIGPNETEDEAEDRVVREYCEATGHWDLFIWKEVKE